MNPLDRIFAAAAARHRDGDADGARALCRRALAVAPDHAGGWVRLGLVETAGDAVAAGHFARAARLDPELLVASWQLGAALYRLDRLDEAAAVLATALAHPPDFAAAHAAVGTALLDLGRPDEAWSSLHEAGRLDPESAAAREGLGRVAAARGDPAAAARLLAAAIRCDPGRASAYDALGAVLGRLGRPGAAARCQALAVRLAPDSAPARRALAGTLTLLGRTAAAAEQAALARRLPDPVPEDPAAVILRHARTLAWQGEAATAHGLLGLILAERGHPEEAARHHRRAARLNPGSAAALTNLGLALLDRERPAEAVACHRRAIALDPAAAAAYTNLAIALTQAERPEEGLILAGRALRLAPRDPDIRYGRAALALAAGDFATGWADYRFRTSARTFRANRVGANRVGANRVGAHRPDVPAWDGAPLGHGTLLLQAEQGLGDTLQFIRYAPLAAARVAGMAIEVPPGLIALLRPLVPAALWLTPDAPWPAVTCRAALPDLPALFGVTPAACPVPVPYLHPDPARVLRWRAVLDRLGPGRRLGIAWQGNPNGPIDRGRSPPLAAFAPLAALPGVRLISLQKGWGTHQLTALPAGMAVDTLGEDFDSGPDHFVDAAAVMAGLDLIVTSDTAIAHLAGALGRPAWVALKRVPDWRWLRDRDDSPWYPSLRLFRQPAPGAWAAVFTAMARAL